jgi:hypothetical protein
MHTKFVAAHSEMNVNTRFLRFLHRIVRPEIVAGAEGDKSFVKNSIFWA